MMHATLPLIPADRRDLAILEESGYEDLAGFLAEQAIAVVASRPPESR